MDTRRYNDYTGEVFYDAVREGNLVEVINLLRGYNGRNYKRNNLPGALEIACKEGYDKILIVLLEKITESSRLDADDLYRLFAECESVDEEILKICIAYAVSEYVDEATILKELIQKSLYDKRYYLITALYNISREDITLDDDMDHIVVHRIFQEVFKNKQYDFAEALFNITDRTFNIRDYVREIIKSGDVSYLKRVIDDWNNDFDFSKLEIPDDVNDEMKEYLISKGHSVA